MFTLDYKFDRVLDSNWISCNARDISLYLIRVSNRDVRFIFREKGSLLEKTITLKRDEI